VLDVIDVPGMLGVFDMPDDCVCQFMLACLMSSIFIDPDVLDVSF